MGIRKVGIDTTTVKTGDIARGMANKAAEATTGEGIFEKAVVVDILADPDALVELLKTEDNPLKEKITNEAAAKQAPRGSLLVKLLSEGTNETLTCAYPFFQSHIMLPAHVGEHVWIHKDGDTLYWLSRIAGGMPSEDVNHTHKDRDLETPAEKDGDAKEKVDEQKGIIKKIIARFNNGAGGDSGGAKSSPEGFDTKTLFGNSTFPKNVKEAIPRYTPRPGDLVFQGSNNTLIALSTDRGWSKEDEDFKASNYDLDIKDKRGSIDIVAGRGFSEEAIKPSSETEAGGDPKRTAPRLMKNDIEGIETDKISKLNDIQPNRAEGDPDFHADLSRLYVSMHSPIDKRLSLATETPILATGTQEDKEDASIVAKSNEIRIVSREDGSIRIIKEKGESDTGASIILNSDGTIHITGEKIFIGKSKEEGGEGAGPAEGDMQPYIKFSVMKEYLESMHKSLNSFCGTMANHICPMNAPSPQIAAASNKLKSELAQHKKKIDELQSERIFGE